MALMIWFKRYDIARGLLQIEEGCDGGWKSWCSHLRSLLLGIKDIYANNARWQKTLSNQQGCLVGGISGLAHLRG